MNTLNNKLNKKRLNKFVLSIIQNKIYEDKSKTLDNIKQLILKTIKDENPNIIVLPEFFNTPLGPKVDPLPYAEHEESSETIKFLSNMAKDNNIYIIGGSIPVFDKENSKKIYNACYSFDNKGDIKAIYKKMHLFDIDIPGKVKYTESSKVTAGGKNNLLTVFETPFAKFGIGICYDIRFYEHIHLLKDKFDIDCMVYPSAFSKPTGIMHWDLLRRSRALDNNVYVIMASPARNENEDSYQIYGYSSVVDPYGKDLENKAEEKECIITNEIDLSKIEDISIQIPTWKNKRRDLYEVISYI